VALLLIAFTLFVPNFWLDRVQPPFQTLPPAALEEVLATADPGDELRIVVEGPSFATGAMSRTTLPLVVDDTPPEQRLDATGLWLMPENDVVAMEEPMFGTPFAEALGGFDFYGAEPVAIVAVQRPAERMPAQVFFIPALLLLALVIFMQRRRQTKPAF
jgi:hypothetical protein